MQRTACDLHSLLVRLYGQCFHDQREKRMPCCIMQCLGRYWSGILHNNPKRQGISVHWMGMNGQGWKGESAQNVYIGVAHAQPSWTDVNLFVCLPFAPFCIFLLCVFVCLITSLAFILLVWWKGRAFGPNLHCPSDNGIEVCV